MQGRGMMIGYERVGRAIPAVSRSKLWKARLRCLKQLCLQSSSSLGKVAFKFPIFGVRTKDQVIFEV